MTTVPSFEIATCSYRMFKPEMGVPVRTTAYGPRFTLGYKLAGTWSAVAPRPEWLRLEHQTFFELYFHHLDELGVDRVLAGAQRIIDLNPGADRVVALCFCDLTSPDRLDWPLCHRLVLRCWLEEQCGIQVPELSPLRAIDDPDPIRHSCIDGWLDDDDENVRRPCLVCKWWLTATSPEEVNA